MSNTRKRINIVIIVCALLILSLAGAAFAKYISSGSGSAELHADAFHISSDILRVGGATYNSADWVKNGVSFSVYNYELDNPKLVSTLALKFTVATDKPEDWAIQINGAASSAHTFTANTPQSASVLLKFRGETPPETVEITVTPEPYDYPLTATFNLANTLPYITVADNGNYFSVDILTFGLTSPITFTWDPELISPDNSEALLASASDESPSLAFTPTPFTHYTLQFVKNKACALTDLGLEANPFSASTFTLGGASK